jgi:hypothetical protein
MFLNSLTGIPVLALFLGSTVLIAVVIIAINIAAIIVVLAEAEEVVPCLINIQSIKPKAV